VRQHEYRAEADELAKDAVDDAQLAENYSLLDGARKKKRRKHLEPAKEEDEQEQRKRKRKRKKEQGDYLKPPE
jgi:hypothetical protein